MAKGTTGEEAEEVRGSRTRRQLLTGGAAGALGVLTARSLFGATPAEAANGDALLCGEANTATTATNVEQTNSGTNATAFAGITAGIGAGLWGESDGGGEGVYGQSGSTYGTNSGETSNGVHGVTDAAGHGGVFGEYVGTGNGVGVVGRTPTGEGVYGQSGSTTGSTGQSNGVHGVTDATGYAAVFGEYVGTSNGTGVQGNATTASATGIGVGGFGPRGVYGTAASGGTGVVASAAFDGTGVALDVVGPAQFLRSGVLTIPAGKASATVTGAAPLTSASLILATVQNSAGVSVAYAVPNVTKSSFTINLNKAVPTGKTAKVGWFIVN